MFSSSSVMAVGGALISMPLYSGRLNSGARISFVEKEMEPSGRSLRLSGKPKSRTRRFSVSRALSQASLKMASMSSSEICLA